MSRSSASVPPSDRAPMMIPVIVLPGPGTECESLVTGKLLEWYISEFAAANAIIDVLFDHIIQLEGGNGSEYAAPYEALHLRREKWIPVLQNQSYASIAGVELEFRAVAEKKTINRREERDHLIIQERNEINSPEIETGYVQPRFRFENLGICLNHELCEARRAQINLTTGFVAKELVRGHTVNVVKGLKLYDNIFTVFELSKLTDYVNDLRIAGQIGELSGETFITCNQKRELIQFGTPVFGSFEAEATGQYPRSHIEPIPATLEGVIDLLVKWQLVLESRRPNSCIVNFFDEGEYSEPFLKPPRVCQPISTLLLSESEMAFGRTLVCDNDGNYKGALMLSLKEGSVLVMRDNSSDMARHVMCPSWSKRISITFFKVWTDRNGDNSLSNMPPLARAMTLRQMGLVNSYAIPNERHNNDYEAMDVIPNWGAHSGPMVMSAPVDPMFMGPSGVQRCGTGVFLPWTMGSGQPARQIAPPAQKAEFLALPSLVETQKAEESSETNS